MERLLRNEYYLFNKVHVLEDCLDGNVREMPGGEGGEVTVK